MRRAGMAAWRKSGVASPKRILGAGARALRLLTRAALRARVVDTPPPCGRSASPRGPQAGRPQRQTPGAGRKRHDLRLAARPVLERSRDRSRHREHAHLREGQGHRLVRALGRRRPARRARRQQGPRRRPRGEGDARPHAGQHPRRPPAARRRHRRLRDHRGDAPLLHRARAQPAHAGEAAHHHLRPLRHHRGREARRERERRERRRPRGLPDRGADGRRDRRRAAHHRAVAAT